jgi:hypothetical protein
MDIVLEYYAWHEKCTVPPPEWVQASRMLERQLSALLPCIYHEAILRGFPH